MAQIGLLAVTLSVLKTLSIPFGVFLLEVAIRKTIRRNLIVGAKEDEEFDRLFILGVPEIGGFALCLVGFALQLAVAVSAPQVIGVSQM